MSRITLNLKRAGAKAGITRTRSADGAVIFDKDTQVSVVRSQMRFLDSAHEVDSSSDINMLPLASKSRLALSSKLERILPGGRKARRINEEAIRMSNLPPAHLYERERDDRNRGGASWVPQQFSGPFQDSQV
jgi:hypothetical protein